MTPHHITVRLEGLVFSYRLNESDLMAEFSKFGHVVEVMLLDQELAPDVAIIEMANASSAEAAVAALDGKERRIEGIDGVTIRVALMDHEIERELLVRAHILSHADSDCIDPFQLVDGRHRYVCRYVLGADKLSSEYSVIGRIVGVGGENVKSIHRSTGCYVKVSGKAKSAEDPLHVRVSAETVESFMAGRALTEALIADMYDDYGKWCERHYLPISPVKLVVVEGSDVLRPLGRILPSVS
jgi:hypothetical protein